MIWLARLAFSTLLCTLLFERPLSMAATVEKTSIAQQFELAMAVSQIAKEMNSASLSNELKAALLVNARSEDLVAVKTLLARFRPSKSTKFEATFNGLIERDKAGHVVFSIESDEMNSSRFSVNGREWTVPEDGSLLNSLQRAVVESPKAKSANLFAFIPQAEAEKDELRASRLGAYLFVVTNSPTRRESGVSASDFLAKKDVYSVLLRGADFPHAGPLDKISAFIDAVKGSPIEVQCTAQGAEGFALIAGTEVAFVTKDDLSVVVQSRGHTQKVRFSPSPATLQKKTAVTEEKLALVQPPYDRKKVSRNEFLIANRAFESLLDLCDLKGPAPSSVTTRKFCQSAITAAKGMRLSAISTRLRAGRSDDNFDDDHVQQIQTAYVNDVTSWLRANKSAIAAHIRELNSTLIIRDQTGAVEACDDAECLTVKPYDPVKMYGYRIPPNNIEFTVKSARDFRPSHSGQSKARIVFACPTRNEACERVELIDYEQLHPKDFEQAQALIAAANRSLNWKESDPSVSQPLSVLRALGPCCKDPTCITSVVKRDAKLIPNTDSKSGGVKR